MKTAIYISMFIIIFGYSGCVPERTIKLKDSSNNNYTYRTGEVIKGKKNGPWVYFKDLQIVRTSYFKNDTLVGITVVFFPNGMPKRIIPFKNGQISGTVEFYSEEGDQIAAFLYSDNEYVKTIMRNVTHGVAPFGLGYNPLEVY